MKQKLKKYWQPRNILIAILIFTAVSRLYNIWYPNTYVFDEVYHAWTAKAYLHGVKDAWSPWGQSPPGVAYEWLHPPIEKEVMAASMFALRTENAWAYRLPGVILGILAVYLVYRLARDLFKKEPVALLSAFFFSIDGLVFVQSRTGMNDVYLVAFILASVVLFVEKKFFWSAVLAGAAFASKWPGVFLAVIYLPFLIKEKRFKELLYFIFIPPAIYMLSYTPYFLLGYRWSDFVELNKQIWWYETNLKATHDYASQWWSWPLNLYPIWYYVDYHTNTTISNIFASGNPPLFWMGAGAVLTSIYTFIKEHSQKILLLILGFLAFWLPWAISPRIMFLYHFSPSVPFMVILLATQIAPLYDQKHTRKMYFALIGLVVIGFLFIYPSLVGVPLPRPYMQLFFKTNITKNPFVNFQ